MRWLQRSVGLAIIGAAALGAAALWVGVASGDPEARRSPREGVLFGIWRVFYDTEMPAPRVMLAAAGVALLLAAAVAVSSAAQGLLPRLDRHPQPPVGDTQHRPRRARLSAYDALSRDVRRGSETQVTIL